MKSGGDPKLAHKLVKQLIKPRLFYPRCLKDALLAEALS